MCIRDSREAAPLMAIASETCKKNLQPDEDTTLVYTFYMPYEWFGETYFHAYADINDDVEELANTVNNWGCSEKVDFLLCPGADFVPSNLVTPKSITSATPFNISYKVSNKGAGVPYHSPWEDKVYLSKTDKGLDGSAVLLSTVSQKGVFMSPGPTPSEGIVALLKPELYHYSGDNYSKTVEINPEKFTDGTYYIYVKVDAEDKVYELSLIHI